MATVTELEYRVYRDEGDLPGIIALISADLSEPYSIFTYRYFVHQWPELSFVALDAGRIVGVIICKSEEHKTGPIRGYVAMLAVDKALRKRGIGRWLIREATQAMRVSGCEEAVLEAEVTNHGAIALYEGLGFVRDKRLCRYYLNGNDAFRLKLWFDPPPEHHEEEVETPGSAAEPAAEPREAAMPTE
ncbi:N-alpha-acetyltransferase 30 [Pavlovales sp. CCMP2436]|nr:N-alpha-acetyltransferase 30 [Pavlovales sp. CCMP2436]